LLDGLLIQLQIHVMDLNPLADRRQQHQGQLATQVFPKLIQAAKHRQGMVGVVSKGTEFRDREFKAQALEQVENSLPVLGGEATG
jgi:hypothetical protein